MRKILIGWLVISLFRVPAGVFAAKDGPKGPNAKAYEKANEKAKFKRGDEGKPWKAEEE